MTEKEALELYIQNLFETDPEWEAKYAVTDDLVSCELKSLLLLSTKKISFKTLHPVFLQLVVIDCKGK